MSTTATPRWIGLRHVDMKRRIWPSLSSYVYNGATFHVLLADREKLPPGYNLDESIEGSLMNELIDIAFEQVSDEDEGERDRRSELVEQKLVGLISDACLDLMKELAPPSPLPEPRTLQEQLYPPTHTLHVFTERGTLIGRKLEGYSVPHRYPPVSESKLQEMGLGADTPFPVPVYTPAQIVLGRRLQSLVWRVQVDGEEMICKASYHIFEHAIGDELESYVKMAQRSASAARVELRIPELKGIVQSHTGVIGILLKYIPHKYHSLRAILDWIKQGKIPETEATSAMRAKWGAQIKETLAEVHKSGVLWRDVKTDNVLIDDNGDAVVLDFGGGNTMGWVDPDKFGTMAGEDQGLAKILAALGVD